MTLIASYQHNDEIVMIGDLMLSSEQNTRTPELPSRFDGGLPIDNPMLSELAQKIVIVSDRIAVAWCGNYIVARNLIRLVKESECNIRTAGDCLKVIADSGLSEAELESVSFIFYAMNCDDKRCHVGVQDYRTGQTEIGPRQKVKYAGQGTYHFLETIGFNVSDVQGAPNSYQRNVIVWLTRASIAFYAELTDHDPHYFMYGGGFELLVPMPPERRFVKVPYSTFFWKYGVDYIELSQLGYSMQYAQNNDLVIDRFLSQHKGGPKRFVVRSLLSEGSPTGHPEAVAHNMFCVHHFLSENLESSVRKILVQGGPNQPLAPTLSEQRLVPPKVSQESLRHVLEFLNN